MSALPERFSLDVRHFSFDDKGCGIERHRHAGNCSSPDVLDIVATLVRFAIDPGLTFA